jgi:coenzyme F420 hydrogenase subunit beta
VVGLPCQVAATAKMRTLPPGRDSRAGNVGLVIGLFCNWALSPVLFHKAMKGKVNLSEVVKFDAPHPPSHSFDIYTAAGKQSLGEEEMEKCVNPFCDYCLDMPSVFADVSVGSGRTVAKGWNIVVVRTEAGARAVDAAKKLGLLETQPVPARSLEHMKRTSAAKVKRGLKKIVERTGDKNCLLYLELPRGTVDKLIA